MTEGKPRIRSQRVSDPRSLKMRLPHRPGGDLDHGITQAHTAIPVLWCVEGDLFDLDEDIARILSELKHVETISDPERADDTPPLQQTIDSMTPR